LHFLRRNEHFIWRTISNTCVTLQLLPTLTTVKPLWLISYYINLVLLATVQTLRNAQWIQVILSKSVALLFWRKIRPSAGQMTLMALNTVLILSTPQVTPTLVAKSNALCQWLTAYCWLLTVLMAQCRKPVSSLKRRSSKAYSRFWLSIKLTVLVHVLIG